MLLHQGYMPRRRRRAHHRQVNCQSSRHSTWNFPYPGPKGLVSSRVNLRIGLSDFFRQQLIDEVLNGGIGLVVGGFDFSGRSGAAFGSVMKQAVSQGTADALVKQDESGGDSGSLFREAVGVVFADALQQAVTFHLA